MKWGTYQSPNGSVAAFTAADARYGWRSELARTYWDLDYSVPTVQALVNDGRTLIVSFENRHWRAGGEIPMVDLVPRDEKGHPLPIGEGTWDDEMIGIGKSLGAMDAEMYVTFCHEPDLDSRNYPPLAWVAAYRRFYDCVKPYAPKAKIGPVFTGWFWRNDYDEIPLGRKAEWVGVDPYCWPQWWRSPQDMLAEAIPPLVKRWPRKPILVCETGAHEDPRKPEWLLALPDAVAKYPQIKGVSYFDVLKSESSGTYNWRMDSSPASLAAARQMLSE